MVRVLHVLGGLNLGGAESRIMDLYRNMDTDQVQFDFLVHTSSAGYYDDEIRSLGGRIYALPRFKVINLREYKKAIRRFFCEHHDYNVVQGHMTSTASIYLPEARLYTGSKPGARMVTVAHTRNAGVDSGIKGAIVKLIRRPLPKRADFLFACSHLAGDETFGGVQYIYVPNTIDTAKYRYDPGARDDIRRKHEIPSDAVVIGNVARFSPQKNQRFLISAFAHMDKRDVYLLLCGDGELKKECEEHTDRLGVSDRVIFAGNQKNVSAYYSAMDIFAFPSVYEGLPGVVVEAQSSGLECLISDTITNDVMLTERIKRLRIEDEKVWTQELDKLAGKYLSDASDGARADYADIVRRAGFDVHDQAERMMRFYLDPCEANLPGIKGD